MPTPTTASLDVLAKNLPPAGNVRRAAIGLLAVKAMAPILDKLPLPEALAGISEDDAWDLLYGQPQNLVRATVSNPEVQQRCLGLLDDYTRTWRQAWGF